MKLLSYTQSGKACYGVLRGDGVANLSDGVGMPETLEQAIAANLLQPEQLSELLASRPALDLGDIQFELPIRRPGKVVCVGRNFRKHVEELGESIPENPSFFLRQARSFVAPDCPLEIPAISPSLDYEGELAVVIGTQGRHISVENAMDHIFGFTCFNDGSVRDFIRQSITAAKNFDRSGSYGPYLVTKDEIPDWRALEIEVSVNGNICQAGSLGEMIFGIPEIIAYVSSIMTLDCGDIIATGTPSRTHFARDNGAWLTASDTVMVTIADVGTLRNRVSTGAEHL